jgi:hypothetical protein
MWILLIIAVHINNPNDIPGKIQIVFNSEKECQTALNSMSYWLKFDSFTVKGECYESKENDKKDLSRLHKPR